MEDFLEGRECVVSYTVLFDLFLPCVTKKTTRDRRIAKAAIDSNLKNPSLCTISDEAFERCYCWKAVMIGGWIYLQTIRVRLCRDVE